MYRIYASMHADIDQGFVWLTGKSTKRRAVVKIANPKSCKAIFCEWLQIDPNFLKRYNQPPRIKIEPKHKAAVINHWYRTKLGIAATQANCVLNISPANGPYGRLRASLGHPQLVVRLTTWLAGISVMLGVIGLGLGAASICLNGS